MATKRDDARFRAESFEAQSTHVLTELQRLAVAKGQEEFGGTFAATVEEWQSADKSHVYGLIFFFDEAPVGCVLLKRPPASPSWVEPGDVSVHGLKIDTRIQGVGLGGMAFAATLEAAKKRWPQAGRVALAVDAENTAALNLYRRHGLRDSDPPVRGRIGYEYRLYLALK